MPLFNIQSVNIATCLTRIVADNLTSWKMATEKFSEAVDKKYWWDDMNDITLLVDANNTVVTSNVAQLCGLSVKSAMREIRENSQRLKTLLALA